MKRVALGTLFVAHSDVANSWLFSIPDHGGERTDLDTGGQRRFWLEGDELIFAQETDVYSMPENGGTPTKLLHYGDSDPFDASPQLFMPVALDGNAFYWTYFTTPGNEVQRHFRAGGDDALLATIPESVLVGSSVWTGQAADQLIFGFTSATGSAVVTVPKDGGALAQLPLPGASVPLAVSTSGNLLWSRVTKHAVDPKTQADVYHHDLLVGPVDGSPPVASQTTLPRTVAPRSAWAAANQAWYLAGDELDSHYNSYLSIWYVAADGTATRLACRGSTDVGPSVPQTNLSVIGSGVVADGALYVSLALTGGGWLIGGIDNAAGAPDNGDAGMPAVDGSLDPAN